MTELLKLESIQAFEERKAQAKMAWGERSRDKAAASNVSYAGGGTGHCDSTGISDIADIDEK